MAAAPGVPMLAGSTVDVCPTAGVAAAAANVTNRRKSHCMYMPTSCSWFTALSRLPPLSNLISTAQTPHVCPEIRRKLGRRINGRRFIRPGVQQYTAH
jgi:hypothetical protein